MKPDAIHTSIAQRFAQWQTSPFFDAATRTELTAVSDQKEREDRFYRDLAFGTGGLRGLMGAGTNRMNVYVVRKATAGLGEYLLARNESTARTGGVAIAFDTRDHSREYALAAALTLCGKGIPTYLFRQPAPTPTLSFAVRHMKCAAGVVITASHNPKEYNGYKVYDANGCQIVPEIARTLSAYIDGIEITETTLAGEAQARQAGLLRDMPSAVMDAFIQAVMEQAHPLAKGAAEALQAVYTPLHGSGRIPVERTLRERGFSVSLVREQTEPDGSFATVETPNPEDPAALSLGIREAQRLGADLVLGTDPDCDRVGVAVRTEEGTYLSLTGNQIGALLVDYVLTRRTDRLTERDTVVKTIVTSELGVKIAKRHGLRTVDTLTGFKYIGEQACLYEKTGKYRFLMGYEESYGYLVGTHARDKDAVVASLLICEMAAYYKALGQTLSMVMDRIYREYGYYLDALDSFLLTGKDGSERILALMQAFSRSGVSLPGDEVEQVLDYSQGVHGLPRENVVKFLYASGSWIALRPSGTEPKLKVYYSICSENRTAAARALDAARKAVADRMER